MDNLNNIPNAGNWGDAASKLNDNFNKVKQAVTTVENTSKNNKGYFTSLSALNSAFPSPKAGLTAYVYSEASSTNYYIYNAVNGAWVTGSIEAPSVGVDIASYTKTGGSTKTTKEVEDDLAQLASEANIVNLDGSIYDRATSKYAIPANVRKGRMVLTYTSEYGEVTEVLRRPTFNNSVGAWEELPNPKNQYLIHDYGFIDANGEELPNSRNSKKTRYLRIREQNTIYNYSSLSAAQLENLEYAVIFIYDSAFNFLGSLSQVDSGTFNLKKSFTKGEVSSLYPNAVYFRCNTPPDASFAFVADYIDAVDKPEYEYKQVFNADVENPLSSGYYTFADAIAVVPQHLQKKGLIITYMAEFGAVTYGLMADSWTSSMLQWNTINTPNKELLSYRTGNALSIDGEFQNMGNNGISNFIQLRPDNTIWNYSVLGYNQNADGTYVSLFIYDIAFNLVGTVNEATTGLWKDKKTFTRSEITALYPTAYYFRCNTARNGSFAYKGDTLIVMTNDDKKKVVSGKDFDIVGYTAKSTGIHTIQSAYRTTNYLKWLGGDVTVTGYSGATNQAALLVFFDDSFEYISAIVEENGTENRIVYNYNVAKELIPENCVYIKANANQSQTDRYVIGCEAIEEASTSLIKISTEISDRLGSVESNFLPTNIFDIANSKRKIEFNNYLGNSQNIHPKVLYFKNSLWGYKFWMGYTPYPQGTTAAENPCIAVSDDGLNWTIPEGLVNPITPVPPNGYNSDTHLIYREDLEELELWYRPVEVVDGSPKGKIARKTSVDGVNWGAEEVVYPNDLLSPAIIYDGGYKMWAVKSNKVALLESDDLATWSETFLDIDFTGITPWHIDVIETEKGHEYAIQCYEPGNGNNSSDLYYVLEENNTFTKPVKIIQRGDLPTDFDNLGIYRASILKIGMYYYIYYSCLDRSMNRWMGLKCGADVLNLH